MRASVLSGWLDVTSSRADVPKRTYAAHWRSESGKELLPHKRELEDPSSRLQKVECSRACSSRRWHARPPGMRQVGLSIGRADTSTPFSYAPSISRSNRSSFFIGLSCSKIISRRLPAWNDGLQEVMCFLFDRRDEKNIARDTPQRAQPDPGIAAGSGERERPLGRLPQPQQRFLQRICHARPSAVHSYPDSNRNGFTERSYRDVCLLSSQRYPYDYG